MTQSSVVPGRSDAIPPPNILQIVLGSDNLPYAKHFWSSVLGFFPAGERLIYSRHNGEVMDLGEWGGATVLYMVGRQELLQLEFWTHTQPRQRPMAAEWAPTDLGFCRLGISVPDFDDVLERLVAFDVPTLTDPMMVAGGRRACFIDPTVGIPIEIMEDTSGLPGSRGYYHDLKPAVVYAAVSVADLDHAVAFFGDVVGLERTPAVLHELADERLWGVTAPRRQITTLRGGTTFLEIVQYETPASCPSRVEEVLDRQGFKTVAVGYRDPAETGRLFERVNAAGLSWTVTNPASFIGGNHVVGAVAHHMKSLSVPRDLERSFGFAPEQPIWWRPSEHASALNS